MSHEIRTPLNGVLGLARMGARDFAQQPVGVTFNRIIDAGAHLLNVINDILDISKLDAGKLAIEKRPFQLAAVFANAASFVSEGMQQKDLAYTTETPPDLPVWVMGDSMRVQQILVNLLSNAVKFTEQGEVRLKVTREGETLIFSVIDTGIGITPEHMDRLFTAFEQADNSTTRKYGGTGLGLAISRNLARMMGGEILVDSTPEHGSTFSLYLPLPEVAAPVERLPDSAGSTGQRLNHLRVLAAEDVEVNRLILEDLLTHEGAQVIFAEHGRQAIERLEEVGASAFDVVLMDVQMPIMDGYEATQRLHAIAPGLPVIGLTAHALEEERQRCLAAGMVAHVTKPIDEDELVAAILAQVSYLPQASPAPENRGEGKPAAVNGTMEDSPASAGEACIDWAAMHTRYQDKPAFVAKLIQTVRNSQADMPDKLRAAATSADLVTIAFLAHAVKGMAGNIFADKLQAMASKTEIAAKSGEATTNDKASELATALATALETLLDELGRTAL